VVKIIANWYAKSIVTVRWKDCQSALFQVKSGVRQGGVLSPILFNMYINIVVEALVKSDLGCHVMGKYFGCLLYADDLILLSAFVLQLEKMLDVCYDVGLFLDIKFNAKKLSLLQVGRCFSSLISNLHVGFDDITWNDNLRYLGAWLHKGKTLSCDINHAMRKFYASANSVLAMVVQFQR